MIKPFHLKMKITESSEQKPFEMNAETTTQTHRHI
jgi:hypothetical protein